MSGLRGRITALVARLGGAKLVAAGAVVVVAVAWYGLSGSGGTKEQLLTVQPGEFIRQVSVSGKVIAAEDVDLGFSQSGRISRVYVKVGDRVGAGATLAEIENGDLRAAVLQKEAALETQQAKLASLKSGTRPEEIAVAQSTVDSDTAALDQATHALLNAIQSAYNSSDDAVHNKLDQFINNPSTFSAKVNFPVADSQVALSLETARPLMEKTLSDWQTGVGSLSATQDLSAAVTTANANLAAAASLLRLGSNVIKSAITTQSYPQATIDSYASAVATGRTNLDAQTTALTSAVTAQKNAAATLDKDKKNLALKQAGNVQADVDAQAAQVKVAEADLASAQAQLAKTVIRAPFAGIVSTMDLKAGGIASANASGISLSSSGTYQIESFVPEVNVALVSVGDTGDATLDAYGADQKFPVHIISIDPAETVRDGVSTYRTKLQFAGIDARIRSGMTANVVITTDKREGVISIPQGLVTEKNGAKYVPVKNGENTEQRAVTTGVISSSGSVEIVSGLRAGDAVVVSP